MSLSIREEHSSLIYVEMRASKGDFPVIECFSWDMKHELAIQTELVDIL